jgi:hypothetical protein
MNDNEVERISEEQRFAAECADCGASYGSEGDSCAARFDQLLALDHSRREPWGSRHGQAFAAFALQHPRTFASSTDQAWYALYRIYVNGERPRAVFDALSGRRGAHEVTSDVPVRPKHPLARPAVTIADLNDFAADTYAARLDEWCRAALAMWGIS